MTTHPVVSRIVAYPLKSLDGVSVTEGVFEPEGSLRWDRRWKIVRAGDGSTVNGKSSTAVHSIRAELVIGDTITAKVSVQGSNERAIEVRLPDDLDTLEQWLATYLGFKVSVVENPHGGFPDDTMAPGPTIVSVPTLRVVGDWFGLTVDDVRRRFRANIEIDGPRLPPFWEDRLFGEPGAMTRIEIGEAVLLGSNPCTRCVVPTRDPDTGAMLKGFQKRFAEKRRETLPEWAIRSRFDHFYRLTVNTVVEIANAGKRIKVGDPVIV